MFVLEEDQSHFSIALVNNLFILYHCTEQRLTFAFPAGSGGFIIIKQAQLPSWVTDRGGELYSRELQTVLDLIVERREKLS